MEQTGSHLQNTHHMPLQPLGFNTLVQAMSWLYWCSYSLTLHYHTHFYVLISSSTALSGMFGGGMQGIPQYDDQMLDSLPSMRVFKVLHWVFRVALSFCVNEISDEHPGLERGLRPDSDQTTLLIHSDHTRAGEWRSDSMLCITAKSNPQRTGQSSPILPLDYICPGCLDGFICVFHSSAIC